MHERIRQQDHESNHDTSDELDKGGDGPCISSNPRKELPSQLLYSPNPSLKRLVYNSMCPLYILYSTKAYISPFINFLDILKRAFVLLHIFGPLNLCVCYLLMP